MNKDRLIEALETVLAELKQPTITFTPPKREPLSDDEIYMGFQLSEITDISLRSFVIGVNFAEKEHGIGE